MIRRGAVLLALLAAAPAGAQVVSIAPDQAAVTIYRVPQNLDPDEDHRVDEIDRTQGLAMIRETRTVELPAGRSLISFRGVADTMVAETAALDGLPGAVIERNEDYNLLTPGSLLDSAIDKPVRVVRTNPATGEVVSRPAVLRSVLGAPVLEVDGRVEALGCSGAPERLILDEAPPHLADTPTFSVLTDVPKAGRYQVRLSYLATGFDWAADYVAKIAPDGRTLKLTGWITLANGSAASFGDAPTEVVAGELSRDDETRPLDVPEWSLSTNCWGHFRPPVRRRGEVILTGKRIEGFSGGEGVEEIVVTSSRVRQTDLGDYKLYSLPEPTTVAARQTKQVQFLNQKAVPFQRVYAYRFDRWDYDEAGPAPDTPAVLLRLENEKRSGLGKPLPSGVVTVMEYDPSGRPVLAGERRVKDTPVGLPLDVEIGRAMDVIVTPRIVSDRTVGEREHLAVEVIVANGKPVPIVLEYRHAAEEEDFKLVKASQRAARKGPDLLWMLRIAAGGRARLTYEVSTPD